LDFNHQEVQREAITVLIREKLAEINRDAGIHFVHSQHKDRFKLYGDWTLQRKWMTCDGHVSNTIVSCPLAKRTKCKCQAKITISGTKSSFVYLLSFKLARDNHAFIPGTRTTLEIFARHSAADHVSDKSLHLKHHQKDAILRSIHDQPQLTAKELLSHYVDTPDSIDFTRRKSVACIISKERTAVLTTKLEGVVVSDSISSLRVLCDRLWFKDALDRHNGGEGCLDIFKAYVIGRQFMESDNAVFITFATPWDLLNVFRAIASGWSLQIHADVTSKASTSALNKLNLGVNQLGGHYTLWSSSLIPAESESSATYIEAYKAASAASRKFIGVRLCEDATCVTCTAIGTLLANRDVKDVLESEAYLQGRKFPVSQSMGDNSEAFQKFVRDHLGMDANICQTHATAIGKNNGTQARHFKNREVHDQFYELVLRIKD
jgi:hypothetical protein